jgi:hypothetical protein
MGSSIQGAAAALALAATLLLPVGIQGKPLPGKQGPAGGSDSTAALLPTPSTGGATAPAKPQPVIAKAAGRAADFRLPAAREPEAPGAKRTWLLLGFALHGAAAFDAYTTRQAIREGHRELDPLMRPFARSDAIYPVMQAESVLLDFVDRRMMRSRTGWMRRVWWLPQTLATAGFVWSGVHNARLPRAGMR